MKFLFILLAIVLLIALGPITLGVLGVGFVIYMIYSFIMMLTDSAVDISMEKKLDKERRERFESSLETSRDYEYIEKELNSTVDVIMKNKLKAPSVIIFLLIIFGPLFLIMGVASLFGPFENPQIMALGSMIGWGILIYAGFKLATSYFEKYEKKQREIIKNKLIKDYNIEK